jgi:ribosome biogenesis GTPase
MQHPHEPRRDEARAEKRRVEFRKNRSARRRPRDLTRGHENSGGDGIDTADLATSERLSGKGDLTRKRTVVGIDAGNGEDAFALLPQAEDTWRGRVLNVHGLESFVVGPDGSTVRCTTRRLLRTMATDQRHPVAAGDWVHVRGRGAEAVIHAIEPRRSSLCRASRGRRHVIVANVDQVLIVGSLSMPTIKPALIDRLLVTAEASGIRPIICLNKADLVDPAGLVPFAGVYARMGYDVVLCSAVTGLGIARLRAALRGRVTAVVGQSGVGKSSLLNALDPRLALPVGDVSRENDKGRHTTTTARLLPTHEGGMFVDTPGVRQFQLWETTSAEVPAAFRDLRPLANHCRFPDCTHSHETDCAVKHAVADGLLDTRRWESCRHMASGGDDATDAGGHEDQFE